MKQEAKNISAGAERNDVKVWPKVINPKETWIYVAISLDSKNNKEAQKRAKEIRDQEMLILRKLFYRLRKDRKPVRSEQEIDGVKFSVTCYKFKKVTGR